MEIDNITAIGNAAGDESTGGNVALFLHNRTNIISNWILVKNSYIADGHAYFRAGMFVSILDTHRMTQLRTKPLQTLSG